MGLTRPKEHVLPQVLYEAIVWFTVFRNGYRVPQIQGGGTGGTALKT